VLRRLAFLRVPLRGVERLLSRGAGDGTPLERATPATLRLSGHTVSRQLRKHAAGFGFEVLDPFPGVGRGDSAP
jgi:hypothetical protein